MNIIPTYQCNIHCPFCFNQDGWNDPSILDLDFLESVLSDNDRITELNIIGGEPTLLPKEYLKRLIRICTDKLNKPPLFFTNLTNGPVDFADDVELHVSYDPVDRKLQNRVLNNMLRQRGEYSIDTIVTKKLITEYGIPRLIHLAKKLHKHINLNVIDIVRDFNMPEKDLRPSIEELIAFSKELILSGTELISFSPAAFVSGRKKKPDLFTDFDHDVSLTPSGLYQISSKHCNGKHYLKSYDDAYRVFLKQHEPADICTDCKFFGYCLDIYRIDEHCIYDYQMMSELEKLK